MANKEACDLIYEIVLGTPIESDGEVQKWDFGFNTWPSPVFYKIEANHPDGPDGYRHPHWEEGHNLAAAFVSSVEDAEAKIKRWTPERRRRYLSQEPIFWTGYGDWIHKRGWMTPTGRKKYHRVYERDGYPFGGLALTDADFRHGITQERLYWVTYYRTCGQDMERAAAKGRLRENHKETQEIKELLEACKDTCPVIYQEYLVYKNIFLED